MMGLKLRMASFWTPQWVLRSEIDQVAEITVKCLDQLLLKYAPSNLNSIRQEELKIQGNLEKRRKLMATAHNVRVRALIHAVGYDEALKIGRNALFEAGLKLGREARERLHVGDSFQDLIQAARILYRVLGIEFEINQQGEYINLIVKKCSLSHYYLPETCRILSAADEGVVQGLNENIHLNFTERMTDGCSECIAHIHKESKTS